MNNHAKRLVKHLEVLGFRRDYSTLSAGRVYRHPNAPDQVIKVFDHMVDNTITAARKRADKIAEASSVGAPDAMSVKERARVSRDKRKERRTAEMVAAAARATAAERRYEAEQALAQAEADRRDIEDLMQPGGGR